MRISIVGFVLCSTLACASNPPAQSDTIHGQTKKHEAAKAQESPKQDNTPAKKSPVLIDGEIATKRSEHQTAWERKDAEERSANESITRQLAFGSLAVAVLMFLVAIAQVWLFIRQLKAMSDTLKVSEKAANAALNQSEAIRSSERAYVQLSTLPPGIKGGDAGTSFAQFQIKNFGRTPARVTEAKIVFLTLNDGESLPATPDYVPSEAPGAPEAFIMPGGLISFTSIVPPPGGDVGGTLVVIGYVDYIDAFKVRHRAGYARKLEPGLDERSIYATEEDFGKRSNLLFVGGGQYNYDRERKEDEGNDWGDKAAG